MESIDTYLEDNPYTKKLKKRLSKKRYDHTIRVARTAYGISKVHGLNTKKSVIAALLHDCAKNLTEKKQLHICEKHHLKLSYAEQANTDLLHAKVGAVLASEEFHVHDADILNAIRYHTTGRPSMSNVEKVLYISDYIEPHRDHEGRLSEIRAMAGKDLDITMYLILEDTLAYLKKKSKTKDPATRETFNYYKSICEPS